MSAAVQRNDSPPSKRRRFKSRAVRLRALTSLTQKNIESSQDDEETEERDEESSDESEVEEKKSMMKIFKQKCSCENIHRAILERLERKTASAAGMKGDAECLGTLRKIMSAVIHGEELTHVCYRHLLAIGGHFGLQVNNLNAEELRQRLKSCHHHRSNLDDLKTGRETSFCFCLCARPRVDDDALGVYYKRATRSSLIRGLNEEQAKIIVDEIGGEFAWDLWMKDGNRMFDWLWKGIKSKDEVETGIGDLILEEFDIYQWHQRERNGQSNRGWLRTM